MSRSFTLMREKGLMSKDVGRDVHPSAFISRLYFENQLCSASITSLDGRTDSGIRITLGDLGTHQLFPKASSPCEHFVLQIAKTRRTSLSMVNLSNQIILIRPHPHP